MTKKEIIRAHYRKMGQAGAEARFKKTTKAQRSEIARQGGIAKGMKAAAKRMAQDLARVIPSEQNQDSNPHGGDGNHVHDDDCPGTSCVTDASNERVTPPLDATTRQALR